MGTNYYIKGYKTVCIRDGLDDMNPEVHIGKRSAAGPYCFDCHQTLCKDGETGIHLEQSKWEDRCPLCGQSKTIEPIDESSGGLELGFNKTQTQKKTGVKSCSSFSWAMGDLGQVQKKIEQYSLDITKPCAVDEYGREFTFKEFRDLVYSCPVWYFVVGEHFC
jgi:hypothetical protein